jgi:hypothetical protein
MSEKSQLLSVATLPRAAVIDRAPSTRSCRYSLGPERRPGVRAVRQGLYALAWPGLSVVRHDGPVAWSALVARAAKSITPGPSRTAA